MGIYSFWLGDRSVASVKALTKLFLLVSGLSILCMLLFKEFDFFGGFALIFPIISLPSALFFLHRFQMRSGLISMGLFYIVRIVTSLIGMTGFLLFNVLFFKLLLFVKLDFSLSFAEYQLAALFICFSAIFLSLVNGCGWVKGLFERLVSALNGAKEIRASELDELIATGPNQRFWLSYIAPIAVIVALYLWGNLHLVQLAIIFGMAMAISLMVYSLSILLYEALYYLLFSIRNGPVFVLVNKEIDMTGMSINLDNRTDYLK